MGLLDLGWRGALLAVGAAAVLTAAASAQNLDQGKPPAKLFADGCSACHHSARGLAKGRFRLTLYMFLRQHYATGSESAWGLASYLESVDSGPAGKTHAAAKPPRSAARSAPRPPGSVPAR